MAHQWLLQAKQLQGQRLAAAAQQRRRQARQMGLARPSSPPAQHLRQAVPAWGPRGHTWMCNWGQKLGTHLACRQLCWQQGRSSRQNQWR